MPGRYRLSVACADASGELASNEEPIVFTVLAYPGSSGLPHVLGTPQLDAPLNDVPSKSSTRTDPS